MRDAVKRRKEAQPETPADAFKRIGAMSLTDKERDQFEAFKRAFETGETGNPRSDTATRGAPSAKWTKADVLVAGAAILRKQSESLRQQRIAETLRTKPANFRILTDDSELPAFIGRLREECRRQASEWRGRFACLGVDTMTAGDFEGTGIDTYIDLSIGFSVWLPLLDEGYYLPYGHVDMRGEPGFEDIPEDAAFKARGMAKPDPQLTRSKVLVAITPYLSRPNHGKTFHMGSARYDLHVAINDGYEIRGCVWDTLDAMRTMNEHEESYGLKPLIAKYGARFGINGPVYTFEDMFGARSPAPFNTEIVGIYAIKDVLYGWRLFEWQFAEMARASSAERPGRLLECYALIDSKLPETDVFLARCGFEIDLAGMKALEADFSAKIEKAKADVISAYNIDAAFLGRMSQTIRGDKIAKWIEAQTERIRKRDEQIAKQREIIAECERAGKTTLKKYAEAKERLAKYESEELAAPIPENAPDYIRSFEFTNDNHIGYLIYDHLGIEDVTPRIKRGKKRSTAADVLDVYYEEEPALEPLATVAAYEKLLGTYVTKIPQALEVDGRLHSEFKAGGTATGRYSSSGYNGRPIDILDEFKVKG